MKKKGKKRYGLGRKKGIGFRGIPLNAKKGEKRCGTMTEDEVGLYMEVEKLGVENDNLRYKIYRGRGVIEDFSTISYNTSEMGRMWKEMWLMIFARLPGEQYLGLRRRKEIVIWEPNYKKGVYRKDPPRYPKSMSRWELANL